MIRLIATDLDGTLLDENGQIPEEVFPLIAECRRRGILFIACSGRTLGNVQRLFAPVRDQLSYICENGAACRIDGAPAKYTAFPRDTAMEIICGIRAEGMDLMVSCPGVTCLLDENRPYTDEIIYGLRNTVRIVADPEEITDEIIKISGHAGPDFEASARRLGERWNGRVCAAAAGAEWFDFTPTHKGRELAHLMKRLGIRPEEAAAFGDAFNDEAMLDSVGHPFISARAVSGMKKPGYTEFEKEADVLRLILAGRVS